MPWPEGWGLCPEIDLIELFKDSAFLLSECELLVIVISFLMLEYAWTCALIDAFKKSLSALHTVFLSPAIANKSHLINPESL